MGIYDRDYARVGPRSSTGLGNLRALSFNTWLIIANVAVFVLANILVANTYTAVRHGRVYDEGVRPIQTRDARADAPIQQFRTTTPGRPLFYRTVYGPDVDGAGNIRRDPAGNPVLVPIGKDIFEQMPLALALGHFSTGKVLMGLEVWRLITFQFLHRDLVHLLFNMLGLWFVGGMVEQYLGFKRYAAFYLVCGIFGALMYLLLNLIANLLPEGAQVPGLLFNDVFTPLIGASAGVFGVLMAAAFIAPTATVYVLFAIPMRLRTAVYLFTFLAALNLLRGGGNAGGDAAHIGGAIAGFFFIRRAHLLHDFFDVFRRTPAPSASRRAASPATGPGWGGWLTGRRAPDTAEVDRILAKVATQGLASLSDAEKRTLRQASENPGGGRT